MRGSSRWRAAWKCINNRKKYTEQGIRIGCNRKRIVLTLSKLITEEKEICNENNSEIKHREETDDIQEIAVQRI